MEDLKEKLPMVIAVIVAIVICVTGLYFFENYKSIYYTQIDNTKIEKVSSSDNMKYEYTLDCYNENGKKIRRYFMFLKCVNYFMSTHFFTVFMPYFNHTLHN